MEEKEYEFSEEELMNVQGGFQHMSDNEHPFNDEKIYGENQIEKLKELKEQLKEMEDSPLRRSGRQNKITSIC